MALIANLRHYLGDDLSLVKIPVPAATLREFLGCIAEAVKYKNLTHEFIMKDNEVPFWKDKSGLIQLGKLDSGR